MDKNKSKAISLSTLESIDLNVFTVKIRDMCFSYQRIGRQKNNLEKINMSFPMSTIYGLLGPSGCGKTTLLKLILGLKSPNSGSIEVNGRKPNDPRNKIPGYGVGFQPQETALYEEFTIEEILQYFGAIYGMDRNHIKQRIDFLIDFLKLPDLRRSIGKLSGGEQRRVSLAIAIIHSPPFIILDEPTVGVDPLLREKIWEHLVEMSKKELISILITTHYVEEAKRAHVVGLMRRGRLLVEQTPKYLLEYFSVDNLEAVFLRVCMAQENRKSGKPMPKSFIETTEQKGIKTIDNRKEVNYTSKLSQQELVLFPNFRKRLISLIIKNGIRIRRNLIMLFFQIIIPTLSIALSLECLGRLPTSLSIGVYNGELNEVSDLLNIDTNCPNIKLSLLYLQKTFDDEYLIQKDFNNSESAQKSVKSGQTFGVLVIDKDFSINICLKALVNRYMNETTGSIKFYGDFSDYTVANTIVKELWSGHDQFIKAAVKNYSESIKEQRNATVSPEAFKPIVEVVDPAVYGDKNITFRAFMTPGMTVSVVYILSVALTALSFVSEKSEGIYDRTVLAGVNIIEILFAQIFVQIFVLFLQIFLLLVILFLWFKITNKGSLALIYLIIVMQGVLGMTYGITISVMAPDGHTALMMAFGSFFPFLLLSGVFWPIHGMTSLLQSISIYLPQTTAVIAIRNIMLKGWTLNTFWVWIGFASTVAWILFFSLLSIILSSIL